MTRQFVELTFYPGEHSGAHEKDGCLIILCDPNVAEELGASNSGSGSVTAQLRDKIEEVAALETELEDVRKGRDEQIEDLESEIDNKDTEIKNLQNELDTVLQGLDDVQDELRDLKGQVMKLWTETEL